MVLLGIINREKTMTINKFQLDTIYWQLLELRGLTDLVDTKKLALIDGSMTVLAEELGHSAYTDEYIKNNRLIMYDFT